MDSTTETLLLIGIGIKFFVLPLAWVFSLAYSWRSLTPSGIKADPVPFAVFAMTTGAVILTWGNIIRPDTFIIGLGATLIFFLLAVGLWKVSRLRNPDNR
ncbi:hypothetical protein CRI94_17315 [Longibacter salinarum]|uniref:Uncharacterized protein n=1 Tax=Longibacter salinarum TaxID=1850348 RepID=A0A2A8CTI0_9BACT|nr:hypothetical protein CRI94_17315 [Longibacter salinarum]